MPEFNLAEMALWVAPYSGKDFTQALAAADDDFTKDAGAKGVTAVGSGAVELSGNALLSINPTATSTRLRRNAAGWRGRVLRTGEGGGTWQLQLIRQTEYEGKATDGAAFFEGQHATRHGKLYFVAQPFRRELLPDNDAEPDDDVVRSGTATPKASSDNPQYMGTVLITSIDEWGPGGDDPAVMAVSCELDFDYQVVRS